MYKIFRPRNETRLKVENMLSTRMDVLSRESDDTQFYELEPAIVLDVVRDHKHPIFNTDPPKRVPVKDDYPANANGEAHNPDSDPDYSWIGRALIRQTVTDRGVSKDQLIWALPLETNIKEYPLVNESVIVVKYYHTYYYTRKLNYKNFINHNADFTFEIVYGENPDGTNKYDSVKGGKDSYTSFAAENGDQSIYAFGHKGKLGKYFVANDKIRPLIHFEGDTIFESRFGSSIRFGAYENNPSIDKGNDGYLDYKDGRGNPCVLIRNRQRTVSKTKFDPINSPEGLFQGTILEDINNDGSSIHLTSGLTTSKWKTTCSKKWFQEGMEEVKAYSPGGSSPFKFPTLNMDQIIVNTDRIVMASRNSETLHFSKKRYSIVTDNEYCVDAHQQIVLTTNTKTVLNSPFIYLGEYNQTKEPVLLGQTTIEWMYELCNVCREIMEIIAGTETAQDKKLQFLQLKLPELLSKRVFVTGGGYAPGQDGGQISGGTPPSALPNIPGNFYGNVPRISSSTSGKPVIDTPLGGLVGLGKPGGIGRSAL